MILLAIMKSLIIQPSIMKEIVKRDLQLKRFAMYTITLAVWSIQLRLVQVVMMYWQIQ